MDCCLSPQHHQPSMSEEAADSSGAANIREAAPHDGPPRAPRVLHGAPAIGMPILEGSPAQRLSYTTLFSTTPPTSPQVCRPEEGGGRMGLTFHHDGQSLAFAAWWQPATRLAHNSKSASTVGCQPAARSPNRQSSTSHPIPSGPPPGAAVCSEGRMNWCSILSATRHQPCPPCTRGGKHKALRIGADVPAGTLAAHERAPAQRLPTWRLLSLPTSSQYWG